MTSHPTFFNLNVVYSLWGNRFSYRITIQAPAGFRSSTSGDPNWIPERLPRHPHSPQPHPWALMSKWKGTHPSVWGARRLLPCFLTKGTFIHPQLTRNIKQMGGKNSSGWSQRRRELLPELPTRVIWWAGHFLTATFYRALTMSTFSPWKPKANFEEMEALLRYPSSHLLKYSTHLYCLQLEGCTQTFKFHDASYYLSSWENNKSYSSP